MGVERNARESKVREDAMSGDFEDDVGKMDDVTRKMDDVTTNMAQPSCCADKSTGVSKISSSATKSRYQGFNLA